MKVLLIPKRLTIFISLCLPILLLAQFQPTVAYREADGRMHYRRDAEGNRIPDFSHAGYRGGGVALPQVPTVMTLNAIPGDNTAHIQAALDAVSALPPDANGWRGALLLEAGRYEIHGILRMASSGVVLRGVGDGADTTTNTVLIGVGNSPNQRDLLVVGGDDPDEWTDRVAGTSTFVTSERVLVGETTLAVEQPEFFAPGDNLIIYHPCTQAWLDAIDGGGGVNEGPWAVGSQPLIFNRRIMAIADSTLTLDVPVYNTLDKSLSPTYVYVHDRAGLVAEVGVEDLRIDIETAGGDDEAHAWNALALQAVEDAWVRNCTFLHFGLAGVITHSAVRVTIDSCQALDPVAQLTGGRMYNFNLEDASSQILVRHGYARNGRHHYVSNGTSSVSGCVFLACVSDAAHNASEGHRRWSTGLLFDQLREVNIRSNRILLGLYNRGDYGTAHGWSAAHSVAWNCDLGTAQLVVQKPPTAQNYAVGCRGLVSGNGPFPGATGYLEGTGESNLVPTSLYEAQLAARLAGLAEVVIDTLSTSLETRGSVAPWRVYPNPASDLLRLETEQPGSCRATLRDWQGKALVSLVFEGQGRLDVSGLAPGGYLIELRQGGKVRHGRWFKQ